jgi:hypothetical protein
VGRFHNILLEFSTALGQRTIQYFGERGKLSYQQHLEKYQEYVKDCQYHIQRTNDFFDGNKGEEKRVKVFMKNMREIKRKRNEERAKELKRLYGDLCHWGSHTAMMPDLLARMPNLTFIEIKVNNSKLESRQKLFLEVAKADGFDSKIARVLVKGTPSLAMIDY